MKISRKDSNHKAGAFMLTGMALQKTENKIKKETKATIRCIPMDYGKNPGKCIVTGKKSNGLVVFGKAIKNGNFNIRVIISFRDYFNLDRNFIYSGTTIFGILGIISIFSSDYLSYVYFGTEFAIVYSIINSVFCLGIIIYSLKSNTWDRISLKKCIMKKLIRIDMKT